MVIGRTSNWGILGLLAVVMAANLRCGASSGAKDTDAAIGPDVVATYADRLLTLEEFEAQYAKSVGGLEGVVDDSLAEFQDFLGRYVDFRLKVIDAVASGVDKDSALVAELEQYHKQLARPYLVDREITDALVNDLFEKQQLEVTASHVLVQIGGAGSPSDTLLAYERISSYRDSILAGADVNEMAVNYSDDPSAKRNYGHLGTFTGGRMILPFESRAYSTPVGEVSEVFRTQFGYHLLFVHDRGARTPEIRAAHILIRASGEDTTAAWEKVQEVKTRLASRASFSDVAREFSEDPGSANNGGDLGFFGRGRMVAAFEDSAFALERPGDRSGWFRTRFGYHIIELRDIAELPSYDESYDELKTLAQRLPRFRAAEAKLGRRYRLEMGWQIDTTVVDSLTAGFNPDSVLYHVATTEWGPEETAMEVASVADQAFTFGEFLEYGNQRRRSGPPRTFDRSQMFSVLEEMLDFKALDVAASRLEEDDAEFAALMKEYRDGVILFKVMEDSVWNRAAEDSVGLRTRYDANASSYSFPERIRALSFFAGNDSLLGLVAENWQPNDTTNWARLFEDDTRFRLDTMYVADSTRSVYDGVIGVPVGNVIGPRPYRNGFILLTVDGIEAPRAMTFEEARAGVLSEHQAAIEEAWLERLRERYGARLYPQNLSGAFAGVDSTSVIGPGVE
jgi:peptidyl-prolyl cis-trans isomerase SurA